MAKTIKTAKGTDLPLLNLRGKDYLQVAHRIQWLSDEVERYTIDTALVSVTDDQTIARAVVTSYNKEGQIVRQATATKRETKKDFSDHTEKAETAAIGRALAMLGYGTQFALSELEEGQRLADSPLDAAAPSQPLAASGASASAPSSSSGKVSSFRKSKPAEAKPAVEESWGD
jgi:hypothetical protein